MKQMSNNRKFLLLTGIVLAVTVFHAAAQEPADDKQNQAAARRYSSAYKSMDMADWMTKQDMENAAVELYQEALDRFSALAREFPAWQRELVEFRMDYCAKQLERSKLTKQPPEPEPEHASAIHAALRLERLPDIQGALNAYSAILKQQPGQAQAMKGAVRCHLRMGSVEAARNLLSESSVQLDSDSELLLLMALVECHYQQFDRAILMLRAAIEANHMNVEAYVAMGVAQAGQGRLETAESEMKKALSLNSRVSEAYYNLAWLSLRQNPGNTAVASTHYSNAIRYGAEPDPLLEKLFR